MYMYMYINLPIQQPITRITIKTQIFPMHYIVAWRQFLRHQAMGRFLGSSQIIPATIRTLNS